MQECCLNPSGGCLSLSWACWPAPRLLQELCWQHALGWLLRLQDEALRSLLLRCQLLAGQSWVRWQG
jgi:hypothetical protein